MKRLAAVIAITASFLSAGLPAHAAGDATYTGTMTYTRPVTPVAGPNEWTFDGTGSGTLASDDEASQASYTGPLSMVVRGAAADESTLGGTSDVQLVSLSGATQAGSVSLVQPSAKVRVVRVATKPIVVRVPVHIRYCNQFGCIVVNQCVKVTITYSVWPFPGASAQTSRC